MFRCLALQAMSLIQVKFEMKRKKLVKYLVEVDFMANQNLKYAIWLSATTAMCSRINRPLNWVTNWNLQTIKLILKTTWHILSGYKDHISRFHGLS